jgi:glycine cleavage system H protein
MVDSVGAIESVKAASEIFSPVSGEVVGVNEELADEPSLINESPEDKGKLIIK